MGEGRTTTAFIPCRMLREVRRTPPLFDGALWPREGRTTRRGRPSSAGGGPLRRFALAAAPPDAASMASDPMAARIPGWCVVAEVAFSAPMAPQRERERQSDEEQQAARPGDHRTGADPLDQRPGERHAGRMPDETGCTRTARGCCRAAPAPSASRSPAACCAACRSPGPRRDTRAPRRPASSGPRCPRRTAPAGRRRPRRGRARPAVRTSIGESVANTRPPAAKAITTAPAAVSGSPYTWCRCVGTNASAPTSRRPSTKTVNRTTRRPAHAEHRREPSQGACLAGRRGHLARRRESPQQDRRRGEPRREHQEDRPRAEEVGADAAEHRPERQPEHLPDQVAREHGLPALVGNHVADPRERERDQRAGRRAGQRARDHQRGQGRREGAGERRQGATERRDRDDAVLAVAVADRTVDQLEQAVGDRERRDGLRRRGESHAVLAREIREQRIADAQRRGGAAAGDRQRDDRPGRDRGGHPAGRPPRRGRQRPRIGSTRSSRQPRHPRSGRSVTRKGSGGK